MERGDFSSKSVMKTFVKTNKANGLGWRMLEQAPDVPPLPGDELLEE
jgi:hypothetical protein